MEVLLKNGLAAGPARPGEDSGPVDAERLRTFAANHRLKVRSHEDGTLIIPGKVGHIWEFDEDFLAVTLLNLTKRKWGGDKKRRREEGPRKGRKHECCRVGMELLRDGDCEGTLLFYPEDAEQVKVALKVAEVKRTRWMSPEHRERFIEAGKNTRFKS
jgi:hypothetical protein